MFDYEIIFTDQSSEYVRNTEINIEAVFEKGYLAHEIEDGRTNYYNTRHIQTINEKRVDRDV